MQRRGFRWRALAVGALVVGLAAMHPAGVRAASPQQVGSCDQASLQTAINNAGTNGTVQFIVDCSATPITLTGPITPSQSVTIDGHGHAVTISGNQSVGVFYVNVNTSVSLIDLTIANGNTGLFGGGIFNFGTLNVTNSTFSGNSAGNRGGGIDNFGTLSVTNSTFSGNSAGLGGAIENDGGTLTVTNSTFSGNGALFGGAIENASGTLAVSNSTFSGNSATYFGGGIFNQGTGNLANTIVAGSATTGGDCSGTITNNGGNLADDNTCGSVTQVSSAVLNLGSLADNGGPTQTIALLPGSVAIDSIPSANCPSTDQRGLPRPDNGEATCDAGAYEYQDPDTDLGLTNVPGNMAVNATSSAGAVVSFNLPTVVDEDRPLPTVSCDHASGATFAIGTTTVTCTASDSDDTPSTASGSFRVTVKGAASQINDLLGVILADHLEQGLTSSLVSQLQAVLTDLQADNTSQVCGDLGAFMHHVQAQSGKKLTTAQATQLLAAATNIMHVIGCSALN